MVCASCGVERRSPRTVPAPARSVAPAHPEAELDCGPSIPGATPLLRAGTLTLLGDYHGTNEIPAFVGRLACEAAKAGLAVSVGLEIAEAEQARFDRYLDSDGREEATRELVAGRFWDVPSNLQDGRRSRAMANLLQSLREMRTHRATVEVFAFDASAHDRDAAMAARVRDSRAARPDDVFLVLVGNVHAAKIVGTPWDPLYRPMGLHLAQGDPAVRSLDVLLTCGNAWNCTGASAESSSCGIHAIGDGGPCEDDDSVRVDMHPLPDARFDGIFFPGTVSGVAVRIDDLDDPRRRRRAPGFGCGAAARRERQAQGATTVRAVCRRPSPGLTR